MNKVAVGFGGVVLILFVAWFFFGKKGRVTSAVEKADVQEIAILVDGGYRPDAISLRKGKKAILKFNRKDPSDCLEEVVLSDFGVRQKLPIDQEVEIEIIPEKEGEFDFSCGMGMFHGKIRVI